MEPLKGELLVSLGCYLMVLLSPVRCQTSATDLRPNPNQAYFNQSLGSKLLLSSVLQLREHIAFSFRTCSYGQLIQQQGVGGDSLRITLTPNGSLEMSWSLGNGQQQDSVVIGDDMLRSNHWYTVESNFVNGEIHLRIEQGSVEKYKILLSNSTYRTYLWDIDLSGGTQLQVGVGYTGCIQGGPSLQLDGATAENVRWGGCPLENSTAETCGAVTSNPCWTYPCANGGTCTSLAEGYRCSCPFPYSGATCENDLGFMGCSLNPCLNGGTCRPNENGTRKFECACVTGFTGVRCEIDKNECAPEPCQNGGVCLDRVGGYHCNCTDTGFEGVHCEDNLDECVLQPCQNGAQCSDTPGSYKCQCPPGYGGKNCEDGLNECSSSPCRHGGTCADNLGYYTCQCAAGYTGVNCETDIDDCEGVTCSSLHTTCTDRVDSYSCQCLPGYYDPSDPASLTAPVCEDFNECISNPCLSGATCINEVNSYNCVCAPGFTGLHCGVNVDECANQPCQNGGSCLDKVNMFECQCPPGYEGATCATDINECSSAPCQNGGQCTDLVANYSCACVAGWTGNQCNISIDECLSLPCQNGGRCEDLVASVVCHCSVGFAGSLCELNIDDCSPNPCANGGQCSDGIDNYSCNCTTDWMGEQCNEQYDACVMETCQNGGTCQSVPPSRDHTCVCSSGFMGDDCEVNIDDCVGHSCEAFQVCFDGVIEYTCGCPIGYHGDRCETEVDECDSGPCLNGGTCVNGLGIYTCECLGEWVNLTRYTGDPSTVYRVGYAGRNCETEVDECTLEPGLCLSSGICRNVSDSQYGFKCHCPQGGQSYSTGKYCELQGDYCAIALLQIPDAPVCHNDGTCQDTGGDYKCTCPPGFAGARCKTNIDECQTNLCAGGATCVDGINEYTCTCPAGLSGVHCEVNVDECDSNPCQAGGRCIDRINGYVCNCTGTGFEGPECQTNIDECASSPCRNHVTCVDGLKGYTCQCHGGYIGSNCEVDVDECASSPCRNNATCLQRSDPSRPGFDVSNAAGYDCSCVEGFSGTQCETNINECSSNPCDHAVACVDGINGYNCTCEPGYSGTYCEDEINECLVFDACTLGSQCIDGLADYECLCPALYLGVPYGGKNCDVRLIACEDHQCSNGATCVPHLEDGSQHNYTCVCADGFFGPTCKKLTTASFQKDSWLIYEETDGAADVTIRLTFRTTLPDGLLVYNVRSTTGDFMILQLVQEDALEVRYENNLDTTQLMLRTPNLQPLNDANWHKVGLDVNYMEVTLTLDHTDCEGGQCRDTVSLSRRGIPATFHHTLGATYFGGNGTELVPSLQDLPSFVGCIQDIKVNKTADRVDTVIPEEYLGAQAAANVTVGCSRVDQCRPDTCSGSGECRDLWYQFECVCRRPHFGDTCNQSFVPATFGFENQISYAEFTIPQDQTAEVRKNNNISLFFRTRRPNGLLFYLGGAETFISSDVHQGRVRVQSQFAATGGDSLTVAAVAVDDGEQHKLDIRRSHQEFSVRVDDGVLHTYTVTLYEQLLQPNNMYFGGLPSFVTSRRRRKKRQADAADINGSFANDTAPFGGTMQDVQQNGHLLQFFPLNQTGLQPSYDEPIMVNVEEGEQTDDLCQMHQPCTNNATCQKVFFNDYSCLCVEGYRGKNCSELDFCMYSKCPGDATCRNLEDGYECLSPATFNGMYSMLQYNHSVNTSAGDVSSIFLLFRTRSPSGLLLHLRGTDAFSENFLTVEMSSGVLNVLYDLGHRASGNSSGSNVQLLDGEWHNVTVSVTQSEVLFAVDGQYSYSDANTQQNVTLGDILRGSDSVYVAGVTQTYRNTSSSMLNAQDSFKGCLNEIRIGDVLLPFFPRSELLNNTSTEQFHVEAQRDVRLGCLGDPMCVDHQCLNGASCRDIWNAYECDCLDGYNGTYCGNDIDECVGHACENGAMCVDHVANYTCDCAAGYTGFRCQTEIDECASGPCQNNATCRDLPAAYVCTCTANFTGVNCEIDINLNCDTSPDLCENNGNCSNEDTVYTGVVTFNCSCLPGFTGDRCESEIDFCESQPCQNNATCESRRDLLTYVCTCPDGYMGQSCESDIDECGSSPCRNGSTCINEIGQYTCQCVTGYEGDNCQNDTDECAPSLYNGTVPCGPGQCIDRIGLYECDCQDTGYKGDQCQTDIDECSVTEPCQNGAACENVPGGYYCNCTLGYEGDQCQTANCSFGQCENGATCTVDGSNRWRCICVEHYEGLQCEVVGPCVALPCMNGGTCSQAGANYTCACPGGWTGTDCDVDVDECQDGVNPCANGGTCENTNGSYVCHCVEGYTGQVCQTNIDDCASKPCHNNGSCRDGINEYTCECPPGYTGTHCETDIDECESNPCENGATCKDHPGSFTCVCVDGYVGDTCHSEDPCWADRAPCLNAGTCTRDINDPARNATAVCQCHEAWTGTFCETSMAESGGVDIALAVGLSVGILVLIIIIIVVVVLLMMARSKRATRGTYSPSRQEMVGSRVEMGNVLKPPPEERLI